MVAALASSICVGTAGASARASSTFASDPSFGHQGLITGTVGPAELVATTSSRATLKDDRGRIIVGVANGGEWQVRRFLPGGLLDRSFGDQGEVVITDWGGIGETGSGANLSSAAIRSDGRILLVGYVGSHFVGSTRKGVAYMVMKQLMPDGSPDNSFGQENGGMVFGNSSGASSVALRADGRFVVAGFRQLSTTGSSDDGILVGLTADGKRDPNFAGGGTINIPGFGSKDSYLLDVDVLPNGRIMAAGASQNRIMVIKLRADGTYDRSFGKGGRVLQNPGPGNCRCSIGRALDRDSKGRIIVAGHVSSVKLDGAGFGITTRFKKSGRVDRSFGLRGTVRLFATPRSRRYATNLSDMTVDAKGGIWVTGSAGLVSGEDRKAVGVRYLPNGNRDKRFRRGKKTFGLGKVTVGWDVFRDGRKVYLTGRYDRANTERYYSMRFMPRDR